MITKESAQCELYLNVLYVLKNVVNSVMDIIQLMSSV
jgi:hypothetical protein